MSTTTEHRAFSSVTRALAEEEEKLLACVHCGFCLNACPTYTRLGNEADSPRGRLYLMRAVIEGRIAPDDEAFTSHIDLCLGCRACETVCPSGVEYGFLLERARAVIAESTGIGFTTRALLASFRSRTLSALFNTGARVMRWTGLPSLLVRVLPKEFGRMRFALAMLGSTSPWKGLKRIRRGSASIGVTTGSKQAVIAGIAAQGDQSAGHRVAILTGCVQEGLFSRVNRATSRVLEANGCTLADASAQRCCGALHAHAGALEGALDLARANIDAFEKSGAEFIVVNAAGCGAIMKEYGELLKHDDAYAQRAHDIAGKVRDISEMLTEIGTRAGGALPLRVTYDAPCHLHHAQAITRAPLDVLRAIPELQLVPLPHADECCGGAGIYGLLHPDLGGRILDDKVAAVQSTKADVVVTPNPGCMMQIGAGLLLAGDDTAVLHPIELLDESYRRAGHYSRS